ncbi:MAG TPA: protein kinase, partial [Thermoanaerobaculia bacterium]|nr:protein kinase [Thermoanaerobaculia bacterium]
MTLTAGSRLGPYEILSPLGAGGMGEVYRARDTRLGREVALKILPDELAKDGQRVSRFEREARSASALSHAHVVAVFDVGRAGETFYIVTEVVAGGTLRELLERGAVPLRRALDLAAQMASGLAEAHDQGIVHRDLKPENVLLTKSGDAKIADFGLAKLTGAGGRDDSQLPTSDGLRTSEGIVMGTVAYMSPEQATGREVDFRSDQFAFGSILYETLTGKSPFHRPTAGETMAAVLRDTPRPVRSLDPSVPLQVEWIVERCLAREPEHRYASTRDLARELALVREHLSDLTGAPAAGTRAEPPVRRRDLVLWVVAGAALLAAAVLGAAWLKQRTATVPKQVLRLSLPPPANTTFFSRFDSVGFAFSPDGSRLAFLGDPSGPSREVAPVNRPTMRVWIRALSDLEARPVPGTEGASALFWSPDGRTIGFFAEGRLKRVDLNGGSPAPVCDVPSSKRMAGAWGSGEIVFASTFEGVIYRVSAEGGGSAVPLLKPDAARGETRLSWPQFLPDGRSFLYLATRKDGFGELMVGSLDGGPSRDVGPLESRFEYCDPGFLVFAREGALFAQRFDAKTAKLTGPLVSLAPAVYYFYTSKWAAFATSRTGTLAYAPRGNLTRLVWFDRSGKMLGEVGAADAGETISLAISPDGRNAVFDRTRADLGTYDIWMIDLARGVETRLTSDPNTEFDPVWLPDGKHVVYS